MIVLDNINSNNPISINRAIQLLKANRSGFYKWYARSIHDPKLLYNEIKIKNENKRSNI